MGNNVYIGKPYTFQDAAKDIRKAGIFLIEHADTLAKAYEGMYTPEDSLMVLQIKVGPETTPMLNVTRDYFME